MKIIFFGTAEFGVETLKALSLNHEIVKVITGIPKKSGRGHLLTKNPIHALAESLDLKIHNTQKPLMQDVEEDFDIGIVVAYGAIISKEILEKASIGFLNLHPSDLPKFRGASPIERTIESGDIKTRVCIIKMTPKLDDGDIVKSEEYFIKPSQNSLDLHKEFAVLGAKLMLEAIELLKTKTEFEKQNHDLSTYAKKISKEELHLQESKFTTQEIVNKIRAFASYGYPFIMHQGKRIKIKEAISSPVKISPLDITCTDGFASPTIIKPEGKNFMLTQDFIKNIDKID